MIILFQECVSYSWSPIIFPVHIGQPIFAACLAIFHDFVHQTCGNYVTLQRFFPSLFLAHQLPKCSAFTGPLSASILSTCPSHRDHCSLKNSSISLHLSSQEYADCLFYPLRHFCLCFAASCNLQLPFIF